MRVQGEGGHILPKQDQRPCLEEALVLTEILQ